MDVIELDCPNCGESLELDAAFAGGVCRCSNCGTLMTVPSAGQGKAEQLQRPNAPARAEAPGRAESPTAPPSRAEAPTGRPEAPGFPGTPDPTARPEAPGTPGAPGTPSAPARAETSTAAPGSLDSDEVFVTPTGKQVKVAAATSVPTARKRKKVIRYSIIGAFVAMCVGLLVVIVLMINLVFGASKQQNGDDDDTNTPPTGPDPAVNPIEADTANLLTVDLTNSVAIVLEAAGGSSDWFETMQKVIKDAIKDAPDTKWKIIVFTRFDAVPYRPGPASEISEASFGSLDDFFLDHSPVGLAMPTDALEAAMKAEAGQIILITSRVYDSEDVDAFRETLTKRTDTRFDAVVIDDHDPGLRSLASDLNGKYVPLKLSVLNEWMAEIE